MRKIAIDLKAISSHLERCWYSSTSRAIPGPLRAELSPRTLLFATRASVRDRRIAQILSKGSCRWTLTLVSRCSISFSSLRLPPHLRSGLPLSRAATLIRPCLQWPVTAKTTPCVRHPPLRASIIKRIKHGWSPEQIAADWLMKDAALFEELCVQFPGRFTRKRYKTFARRVAVWRQAARERGVLSDLKRIVC